MNTAATANSKPISLPVTTRPLILKKPGAKTSRSPASSQRTPAIKKSQIIALDFISLSLNNLVHDISLRKDTLENSVVILKG
jgi:hypothetical protein